MTGALDVPQPLAAEILQQYADVLRVGRVIVNGAEVCWSTAGSTASQLKAFSEAFCEALRKLPESQELEDAVLSQAVYWFCKVVSINYVLCEVLQVVKAKVGKECSISTSSRGGRSIVDYCVEVRPDEMMRVHLVWSEKGNIVHCDPITSKKTVKGTLSSLATEFPIRASACYIPSYSLHMKVNKSYKQKMISKVTCVAKGRRRQSGECVFIETPLHSSSPLSLDAGTICSTEAPSCLTSEDSVDSIFSWDDNWDASSPVHSVASPLRSQASPVTASPSGCTSMTLRDTAKGLF